MRKKLLLSTAALLAGFAIASAQDMPGGKTGGQSGAAQSGAQTEHGSAGAGHEQGRAGQASTSGQCASYAGTRRASRAKRAAPASKPLPSRTRR
jgi:hypothetical protein